MRLPPCLKLATSLILALGSASAFAGSVSIDTDTAAAGIQAANTINANGNRAVNVVFNRANPGEVVASVSGNPGVQYNTAIFNVASNNASCTVNEAAGTVAFIALDFAGVADGAVICTLTFTDVSGVASAQPITLGGLQPLGTTPNNGTLNVSLAPPNPTTINFAPTTVNLANGGNPAGGTSAASIVAVTTGGAGVDAGSYSCTIPPGFQLVPNAGAAIPAGSDPADISVTCTLGAVATSANSTCTRTGGADVVLTLNCPAGAPIPAPILTPTPANGTPLTCNGAPLSTATTQISISNTGTLATTGLACSTTGAGFSVQQQPGAVVAPGGSTSVIVSCSVPAEGLPAIQGTLNCAGTNGGGALAFPLSSLGVTGAVSPTTQQTIPATSMWAKIGLIGLLAALGALVVGFRRHS